MARLEALGPSFDGLCSPIVSGIDLLMEITVAQTSKGLVQADLRSRFAE